MRNIRLWLDDASSATACPFRGQAFHDLVTIWLRRGATRRRLRQLDPRELQDIGISPDQRAKECARWFWDGDRR